MEVQQQNLACASLGPSLYTTDQILDFKNHLEHKTNISLHLGRPQHDQISLTCHNQAKYQCCCKYLFRKTDINPEHNEYALIIQFDSHHVQCLSQSSKDYKNKTDILSSPSFKRYKPQPQKYLQSFSPYFSLIGEHANDKSEPLQKSLQDQCWQLQRKHSGRLYTEDEIMGLKKQLQFESKGLISKSTQFHPEQGFVLKISFKCKYQNTNCPYLSTLTYTYQRNEKKQKLFKLDKINKQHNKNCILEEEDLRFNFITRKIDENFDLLVKIIRENPKDIKPKKVLQIFTEAIGEEVDFIYFGIENKNNRRAAKKYFDNSVAKARNTTKEQQSI